MRTMKTTNAGTSHRKRSLIRKGPSARQSSLVRAARLASAPDYDVRLKAFETLRDHGDARWRRIAMNALEDSEDVIVATALECLVEWGARSASKSIVRLLEARSELTRAYAAWALGQLGAQGEVSILRRHFSRARNSIFGSALAEALYILTDETSYLQHLKKQLRSTDPEIRAFTSNSLVGATDVENAAEIICALTRALSIEKSAVVRPRMQMDLPIIVSLLTED
jgi:HEAT repeat protein